ncbi:MAG: AAA family ATPase [Marinifilaceae bacterium]
MNTLQLIEQSESLFANFEKVDDKLYKGKLLVEEKTAGIYYFNFNQRVSVTEFEELQYKYLAEEFYKQKEALQWNIYMIFINSNIDETLKLKILKDDKYARKLIFTDNEFLEYFELEKSKESELPDIVSTWKEEFNKVGLQELYGTVSNEGIIRNFLNNTASNFIEKKDKNLDQVPVIYKISSIALKDDYRPFPKVRDYSFGSVNLFTGSNGVGKTSLLESIELILTGKTQRNNDKNELPNSITAILNEGLPDTYTHQNKKYKERGTKWYNRRISEVGNQTFKSFNQFNFFNADAAHQFSNSEEKDVINESLKQIILGEEYTALKDKIQKIRPKLRSELNKSSELIKVKNDEFKKNSSRISELRNNKNFEALKENIKSNISGLGYKTTIDESSYSVSSLFVNEIKNELDFILSKKWITDYKRFTEIKETVLTRIRLVSESKIIYNRNIEKSNERIINKQKREHTLSKANEFLKYLKIDNSSKIESLENSNERIRTQLLIIKTLKELNDIQLDVIILAKEHKSLPEIIILKVALFNTKNDLLKELKIEISTLQESFSKNEKLVNELKNIGKNILNHNLHSNNCPLCEQQILHSDLLLKLETEFTNDSVKSIINSKNEKIGVLNKEISQLEIEIANLKQYEISISSFVTDYKELSIVDIDKNVKERISKEKEILVEKELIDKIFLQLNSIGGEVSKYIKLKSELSLIYSDLDISNNNVLTGIVDNLKTKIDKNISDVEKFKDSNIVILNDLNGFLKLKDYNNSIDNIEEIVKSKETVIESLNFSFENLNRYIQISDDKNIIDLAKDLDLLKENINTLRLIENSQNEIKKLLITNEAIEQKLPALKALNSRLNKAVETLDKLSKNSEDLILEEFFKDNLNEITDIYKTIHSPKEFSNLEYKDNRLVLFKNEEPYEVSQISTGQKSALVLSIFISLNRKLQDGPKILIFDDPVSFIDDFNALSFLDFLRYFIVKEKKQIFFATANKKFATLFKKKFNFLGEEEFKEFQLER